MGLKTPFHHLALLILFAVGVLPAAYAQPIGPRITFAQTTVDKGIVPPLRHLNYEYTFTNTGDQDLMLTNVKSSCGCVAPSWSQEPVKPGESGVVRALFDVAHRFGPQMKSLSVQSNDTTQPFIRLTLKCEVKPTDFPVSIQTLAGELLRERNEWYSGHHVYTLLGSNPYVFIQMHNEGVELLPLRFPQYWDQSTGNPLPPLGCMSTFREYGMDTFRIASHCGFSSFQERVLLPGESAIICWQMEGLPPGKERRVGIYIKDELHEFVVEK